MKALLAIGLPIAFALCTLPAQGAELGRLFYTPMQRLEMDRARLNPVRRANAEGAAAPAPQFTVNGRITTSGGQSTTWVNGVPDYDPAHRSAPNRSLKIGQTVDSGSGEVRDPLQGGTVVVKPAPR